MGGVEGKMYLMQSFRQEFFRNMLLLLHVQNQFPQYLDQIQERTCYDAFLTIEMIPYDNMDVIAYLVSENKTYVLVGVECAALHRKHNTGRYASELYKRMRN